MSNPLTNAAAGIEGLCAASGLKPAGSGSTSRDLAADATCGREPIGNRHDPIRTTDPVNRRSIKSNHWALIVGVMIVVTGLLSVIPFIRSAPASALPGGPTTWAVQSGANQSSPKTLVAYCPQGTRVVGGGGDTATANGFITEGLALTRLEPVRRYDGVRDAYVVTAAKSGSVVVGAWKVRAYATRADPATLPGLQIVPSAPTAWSSAPMRATSAVCPAGQRVIGTQGAGSVPQLARSHSRSR